MYIIKWIDPRTPVWTASDGIYHCPHCMKDKFSYVREDSKYYTLFCSNTECHAFSVYRVFHRELWEPVLITNHYLLNDELNKQ